MEKKKFKRSLRIVRNLLQYPLDVTLLILIKIYVYDLGVNR